MATTYIHVSILPDKDTTYKPGTPWRDAGGAVNASLTLDPYETGHRVIQGPPAELRRLAKELTAAADQADAWATDHPAEKAGR
jgi:hypothetical protein